MACYEYKGKKYTEEELKSVLQNEQPKVRRVLELQSDLFQKGRDKKSLITDDKAQEKRERAIANGALGYVDITGGEVNDNRNQFLQLLNKKNNWVTFFVKSIIQDSVKKGYEKILFPKGDTAAKIEGHQTLEEFKKQKEDRIKELQSIPKYHLSLISDKSDNGILNSFNTKEEAIKQVEKNNKAVQEAGFSDEIMYELRVKEGKDINNAEIETLKKELADVESGQTQLSSIAKFYEETITNILKKQGYNPVEITDEYGNTWNEIDLSTVKNDKIILQTKNINDLLDENKDDILYEIDNTKNEEISESDSSVNINDQILFNNKEDGAFTAKEVLDNIKVNYKGFTGPTIDIINKLLPILNSTNAKIKFVNRNQLSESDTLMEYDPNNNEIRISKETLSTVSPELAVRGFLHEVLHSVTIYAYTNPISIEAQLFRDLIDEMYYKYKDLSGFTDGSGVNSRTYGFTNQLEFIAEIMTNPKFQAKIKDLEGDANAGKGLWSKLIDYIRTLIGVKKTSDYNKIVDSITSIAMSNEYEGGLETDNIMFQKKTEEEDDVNKDKRYYKLRNISDRLTYTYDKIKDNIERNIANYEHLIKVSKESDKIAKYKDKLVELLNELEKVESTNEWKGIAMYTQQLAENISQLERRFLKEDLSVEGANRTIYLYNKYLETNALVGSVQNLLSDARLQEDLPITKDELETIQSTLTDASGKYDRLKSSLYALNKQAAIELLNDRVYAPKVLFKWKEKLKKEHKKLGLSENVNSWVSRQMNTIYKDEIDKDVYDNALDIVEDPAFDISTSSALFDTALNTNSELIQVAQTTIDKMRSKIIDDKRALSLELQSLFEEFIAEKGNGKPSDIYKNMYEEDSEGNVYLKGEYSVKFKEEYDKVRTEHNVRLAEIEAQYGKNHPEYKSFYKKSKFKKWKDNNLKEVTNEDGTTRTIPVDKWLNKQLSPIEEKVLKKAREVFEKSQWQTYKINSLVSNPFYGVKTYRLPSITASSLENIVEGKGVALAKDTIKDLTSVRLDDVGHEEVHTDIKGNPIRNVKIHFRGKLDKDQQSLDLFTLVALEGFNGINYRHKQEAESSMKVLLDVAKHKDYYQSSGLGKQILSRKNKRIKAVFADSSKTNVYKRLENLIEMNIYDILHKSAGTLGPLDLNKAIGTLNGWTALVGLSVNEVSAVANIMNGKAQMFLEGVAGNYISFRAIAKAEKMYFSKLHESFADINKPVSVSFINQLTDMFDTYGAISVSMKQAFIKNGALKSNLNMKSLQFMQDTGEHWMQSVLTMAVLEDIKVMDKNSNFIDINGKIVKEEKDAASLLDMAKMVDGKLTIDPKVVYTTRTLGVEYNNGGREMIAKLVKKKVFDTAGVYDSNMQPEAMRHGVGKLVLMYRKFLVPLGMARFRGFAYGYKKLDDLEEHQVFFSHALQDYETGTYTEVGRYMVTSISDMIQAKKFEVWKSNWNELTDTQKLQIAKGITEFAIISVILPAMIAILGAMGADDDDDGALAFALLQLVRLKSELNSFTSIDDQYKILNSPIPSLRILENLSDVFTYVFQPWNWDERYDSGKNAGSLKVHKTLRNLTPIINSTNTTYKEYRTYIEKESN